MAYIKVQKVWNCMSVCLCLTCAGALTALLSSVVVLVSLAASVGELLTFTHLAVVVPVRK